MLDSVRCVCACKCTSLWCGGGHSRRRMQCRQSYPVAYIKHGRYRSEPEKGIEIKYPQAVVDTRPLVLCTDRTGFSTQWFNNSLLVCVPVGVINEGSLGRTLFDCRHHFRPTRTLPPYEGYRKSSTCVHVERVVGRCPAAFPILAAAHFHCVFNTHICVRVFLFFVCCFYMPWHVVSTAANACALHRTNGCKVVVRRLPSLYYRLASQPTRAARV